MAKETLVFKAIRRTYKDLGTDERKRLLEFARELQEEGGDMPESLAQGSGPSYLAAADREYYDKVAKRREETEVPDDMLP